MMRTCILLALLVFSASLASQANNELNLNFTASHTCTDISLDSILIENLSRPGSIMLYFPQTTYSLFPTSTDIIETGPNELYVTPNYPNPFTARTDFDVLVPDHDIIKLDAYDLTGRLLATFRTRVDRGTHNFTFFACGQQNYLIIASTGKAIHQRLMTGNGIKGSMAPRIVYNGNSLTVAQKIKPPLKSFVKSDQGFDYETGDELKYTGFVTGPDGSIDYEIIIDIPQENTSYSFDISNAVPEEPSAISGPVMVIRTETGLVYEVEEIPGLIYNWEVPGDWEITGGQGSHSITVDAGYENGEISVSALNNCGAGPGASLQVAVQFALTLGVSPAEAGVLDGAGYFREGEEIKIMAKSSEGWMFVRWTGAGEEEVSDIVSFSFLMPAEDVTFTAHFVERDSVQTKWFVAPNGSDATGDGTKGNPFATILKACSIISTGDTILLRGGIYNRADRINSTVNGTPDNPVVIKNYVDEEPIIDGTGLNLGNNASLLMIERSGWMRYYIIEGITVRNSSQRGIGYYRTENLTIRYCTVHDIEKRAIGGYGDHTFIESNTVYNSGMQNQNGTMGGGGWPIQIAPWYDWATGEGSNHVIIRNNLVYNSWGEGIGPGVGTHNALIEGNTVHDVWSQGIYIDRAADVTIRNNHIWNSNPTYYRNGQPANGIGFSNETNFTSYLPTCHNIYIYNNLMSNNQRGISFWYDSSNNSTRNTYHNIYIAYNIMHNTTVHAIRLDAVPQNNTQPHDCMLKNNILYSGSNQSSIGNLSGWNISHNNWVGGIPSFGHINSFALDPLFVNPGISHPPADFRLSSESSPCFQAGEPLPEVTTIDYWGNERSATIPSIGIHEIIMP
jgi:parallel beta-helix repeat protein